MRRHFLTLLVAMIATTMSLNAQVILIDEGFENGIQDSVWTQEFVVGHQEWKVESLEDGLNYPANVWQGSKRAYLRNNTGETQGYVTRLISKTMDLRPDKVYQPELTFWYANPKWTADRDTLRVLYRTGPKAGWRQLREFSSASANWQKVHIELPEVNETYQIAFEGTDNLGHGIVLDSIKLRSAPQCVIPHDISITHQGNGKVFIGWLASWDADSYDLIITKDVKINPDTIFNVPDSLIAVRTSVEGLFQNYETQLESGAYYYIYLRSVCVAENSMWNSEDPNQKGHYRFRVKATKNVPYYYGFNLPYEENTVRRDLEWTWGGNTGHFNPYINVQTKEETDCAKYSKDSTRCVIFTGANNLTTPVPANKYAYVATPAIADTANADFALNQCQVRFWTTVYQYTGRKYAHSLIVGVMTDPEDITTFEPIDTVSVWGTSAFVENIVDLSSYQGTAGYVAFKSDFDKQNIIYLDDVTIEYKTNATKVTKISVNPRDTYAEISWEGDAPSYNLLITSKEVDPANPGADFIVEQTIVTGNSYKTEALEADHSWNRPYYVYVQAVNGENKSDWSYRYPFVTIASKKEAPFTFDFEQASGFYKIGDDATSYPSNIGMFSNDPGYPHMVTSNPYTGSFCLNLTKDWGNDSWITLPPVDSLKNLQVTFYMSGASTPAQAFATVGVMTNPMDINTFIPVIDCKLASDGHTICYANFLNYNGPEGIIAIVWSDVDGGKQTVNYIDDLVVEEIAKCLPPVNLTIEASPYKAIVSWDKSEASMWEFILADSLISEKQLKDSLHEIRELDHVIFADTLVWSESQNDPKFDFDSLEYNSPYYIYVRTVCGDEVTWWVKGTFKTPCPNDFPIPFYEDFEGYPTGDYSAGFECWQFANYGTGTGYPKILNLTTGAQSGNQLELWSTSTTQRNLAVLPGLDADLSQMVLSFKTRSWSATAKSVLYVGSIGDINDWTTFVAIDTIYNEDGNTFNTIRLDLSNYNLVHNNIAFTSGLGDDVTASDVMIDEVSVKPNTCIEAWNFEATDIQTSSIDIKWEGKSTNDEWVVKVLRGETVVIADSTITGKAFHAGDLAAMTAYTFCVKPSCDTVWSEASFWTPCAKLDPTKPNKETFDGIETGTSYNAAYQIPCWTTGNGVANAGTSYLPYVYKSATYASSGTNTYRVNESSSYAPAYVVSPEIDIEHMKDLAVTFNAYSSTSYYFVFGVMSDPTDLSTFVPIDSVKGTGKSVQFTYDLSEYADSIPATAKYCCWRGRYAAADLFYLDDVSIIKVNCPLPKPNYSGLTHEQIRISAGLRTDNDWVLLVSDTAAYSADELALLNIDSLLLDSAAASHIVFYDTIDAKNKVVKGLKEQTDYYAAVASVCEEGLSQWAALTFQTACKPLTPEALGTIVFAEEDGYGPGSAADRKLPCWTIGNKNGLTGNRIPYIYNTSGNYWHNDHRSLEFYTTAAQDGAYGILPALDIDDIKNYQVNFWGTAWSSGEHKLIVGVITDPSDLNTFTVVDTVTMEVAPSWLPFTIPFDKYEGDYLGNQGKYVMFLSEFGASNDVNITEISVDRIPSCRLVNKFVIDSVAEDVAVVSWDKHADSYRILMSNKPVADEDKATYSWILDSVVTNTEKVLFEGLKPATNYYLYAQSICGEDSSAISMAYASIFTDCPTVKGYTAPYFTDFDNNTVTGSGKKPDCWDGVYLTMDTVSTSQSYPYVYTTASYAASGKNSVYMYSYGYWNNTDKKYTSNTKCYAVAPKVAGDLNEYMVSFYARKGGTTASYGSKFLIGYVMDATERGIDSSFVKITAVDVTTATQQAYQVILSDYTTSIPAGARITLKADWSASEYAAPTASTSYYGTMYIDNFKIGFPPSCYPPVLEAGNTSMYTADINITPAREGNNKWELAVVPDSIYTKSSYDAAAYLGGKDVRIVVADSTNFVVSDLEPGTKYWIYGRTVCGGEDGNSAWTDMAISTRTKYYFKDSFYFGFGKEEGWEFCQGSTSTTYWVNPAIGIGYTGGNATTSYTSYYPYCMMNTTSSIYAYGPREASDPKNGVLRWYSTSTYWGGYAVFPAVAEAHDRSFEFKVRCGYGSYNSTKDTIGISTNYECDIEIGTIDKNKGFETYQLLATVNLPVIPKVKGGLTEANDWFWTQVSLDLDSDMVANKQMVLRLPKSPDSNSRYIHFDDVTLGAPKGFGLVSLKKVQAESNKATVTWDNIGGPWNLYILKANGDTLKRYENITDATSQVVEGLTPQTSYTAVLVAADAPTDTKFKTSAKKAFRTPCTPIEPDANGAFVWNFNSQSEWEQSDVLVEGNANNKYYFKPECFTVGTTYTGTQTTSTVYYNWLIQRKGFTYAGAPISESTSATSAARYEYGRNDSPTLRIYSSSSYMTPYIVMPELNCSFDTMMIEFWGRCFCNYASDYGTAASQNKIVSTSYLGASYSQSMVVGTLTDPNDFSTLEVIDTVTYNAYTSTTAGFVTDDPTGNRYWQKFQLPLSSAKGKYLVLFQPKYGMFFLDDLSVKPVGDNLFAPGHAATVGVTKTTADFTWEVKHPNIQSVVVVLDQDGDNEVLRDTVDGSITNYTASGLQPSTSYQWYMYQTNGTINTDPTPRLTFSTECVTVGSDYKTGFELADGWQIIPKATGDYRQAMCWTYGNAGTTTSWSTSFPYNNVNTTSYVYSYSGDYAPKLYAYSTTMQTYIAMPEIEDVAAFDTLQVNFWMRPGYHVPSTGKISTQYTLGSSASTKEYYYAKSVIVGTMSDPSDATTFVPIDTINYNGTFSTSDYATPANNYLFQKCKVPLTGANGKYVAFMATLWAKGAENKSTYDYMFIDDVWFSPIQRCEAPVELTASEISSTSAKLTWEAPEGAAEYVLQVSTDPLFAADTAFVYNDTVNSNSYVVTGMEANTEYIWRVLTICGEDLGQSDFTQNAAFKTARAPYFMERFTATNLDADWSYGTTPALEVIDSTDVEITGANNSSYGFHRVETDYGLKGSHYCVPFYSSSSTTTYDYDSYWFIMPSMTLDENKPAHMTFDMALSASSISTPNGNTLTEANMANDYTFIIIVSEDGGKTWKKENIIGYWNNLLPAGNQLRDIPTGGTNVRLDLAKYAGKTIRIAFYRYAETYLSATCAVHLDNIRVNYYDNIQDDAQACQFYDIEKLGFYIDGDKAAAGSRTYTRYQIASDDNAEEKGYLDSIYTLGVTYLEVPERIIEETICDGESYIDENFNGKTRTGVYRRKLESVEHCDSIVTLKLYVAPKESSTEKDTICFGGTYTWQGKTYNRSGLYTDTLLTQYGCDSVLYLNLFVRDQITGEEKKEICFGSSYTWPANGETYSESGTHKATLTSVTGCDSIVTLTVEVSEIIHGDPQKETICHGGKLSWNGKVYDKAGIYTDTTKSAYGCDSVSTLELTIAPIIEGMPEQKTICSGATYTWGGKVLSQAGTYKDTVKTAEGCDSVAILALQIADVIIGAPVNVAICEGATYTWNGKVYDTAGTYKDTLQSAGGCDSVATMVLTVSSVLYGEPENVSICEGDSYKWNGNDYTLPGTFKDTVPSSFGCDSIITLVLTYYAEEDTIRIDSTISLAQLPFTYENAAYPYAAGQTPISYAEGTELGSYSDTVFVEGKHCTAVMILNLTIKDEEHSIGNIGENNVVLQPNVIRAGETVTAYGNFNGMVHIQVYDIVGRLIKEERNDAKSSISIDAFPQSGIYTVRISDSNATQYVGRVLVK